MIVYSVPPKFLDRSLAFGILYIKTILSITLIFFKNPKSVFWDKIITNGLIKFTKVKKKINDWEMKTLQLLACP